MIRENIAKIGTSGIVIPGNKSGFPREFQSKSRLHYYASLFNSLEVNSTFYKIPMASTMSKWAMDTPADFQFTVKLWRGITHEKGLEFSTVDVKRFMKVIDSLADKKGCLLVQFPASVTVQYLSKVQSLLDHLQEGNRNRAWRIALEFRHKDWYMDEVYSLLHQYGASIVLHDMPASACLDLTQPSAFLYFRFHGNEGKYKGSYSKIFLQNNAMRIKQWLKQNKEVYVYFNNTIGDAFINARDLSGLLKG